MGARIYDPEIGRFLSADPLFEAFPNQSPYSYALNNPISFKDPSGLAPEKEKGWKNQIQGGLLEYILDSIFGSEVEEQNAMDGVKKDVTDDGEVENKEEDRLGSSGGSGGSSSSGSGAGIGSVGMGAGVNVANGVSSGDGTVSGMGGGVFASDNLSQRAIRGSVEKKFGKYITFEKNGRVNFENGAFDKARNNPNSNFAKLYELATNNMYNYYLSVIKSSTNFNIFYDDWSSPTKCSFNIIQQWFINSFDSRTKPNGIFLADRTTYGIYQLLTSQKPVNYVFFGNENTIYINSSSVIGRFAAHELFIHALMHLRGIPWWHSAIYHNEIIEYQVEHNAG